ncbi:PEP-CTERM sorting domain-containing protein [Microcoleus sp. D3_18a_C4]|uniref:PEP-CTERM sorting domain-containing protein n=1 Tax=Microcoleus sp. D3_18a_C4 TaxID=3055332 RepID=UPI002FCF501D
MKEKNLLPVNLKIKVSAMKSQFNLVKSILAVAGVAAVSAVSAAPASAFSFSNIASDNTSGDAYVNSFSFDVLDRGSNNVLFNIFNNNKDKSAADIFIAAVHFDTGSNTNLLSAFGIINSAGVNFTNGATPLPQTNNLATPWSTDFAAGITGTRNGVQAGEVLGLSFTGNYNNVVSALNNGTLRLGMHVRGIGKNGDSDVFVSSTSNTEATPEPLTMLAAAAAVGFGAKFKKQRAQAQKAE